MSAAAARATRVLVLHPGALGDLVQALPAIGQVRAAFPAAPLALLVGASLAPFAAESGLVDVVLPFDDAAAYHGLPWQRARVLAGAVAAVRRFAPTHALTLKASPVYAALARLSGARGRAGLARGIGRFLLTRPVPLHPGEHWEQRYRAAAVALGAGDATAPARWPDALPRDWPADATGPLVGIAPGGARNAKAELPQKRWPVHHYADLARALVARHPRVRIVLFGAPGDRAEADAVAAVLGPEHVIDLVGRTSVAEARAGIARLDAFVGNDSALLHVAGTTDTPVVAVFGPTDPRALCPTRSGVVALWQPAASTPCYDDRTGDVRPCVTPCCMDRVSVGAALAAVEHALSRTTALGHRAALTPR